MSSKSNKTLRCYDSRDGRNRSFKDKRSFCYGDRVTTIRRNNNNPYHDTRSRNDVSFETQASSTNQLLPTRNLVRTYIRENTQITINSNNNNNKQDSTTESYKTTPPGSDKIVKEPKLDRLPDSNYYKIIIPDGHKNGKHYIINNILNYVAPANLLPIKYRENGNGASFFIDDKKVAVKLLNYGITTTRGQKLTVRVTIPPFPRCEINDEFREKVKQAMVKRYVPVIKMMDMSNFHRDPDLVSDHFCALSCPAVLDTVFNVLSEHMSDLKAINLHGNILDIDLTLRMIKSKLLQLKVLHIGDNSIKDIEELNAIKDLKLEELILIGNPICNKYQSQNDYIKEVQKRCPELLRLDGMNLQKPVLSDAVDKGNNTLDSVAYPEAEMTDQKAQMTDPKKQASSVYITVPSLAELPSDVKRNTILKLREQNEYEFGVESEVFNRTFVELRQCIFSVSNVSKAGTNTRRSI